mgnify:CR=1 FL=1
MNPLLFNITDLPSILEYLYQSYFPSLQSLKELDEVHRSLIYLNSFSKLPFFMPKQIYTLIEEKISSAKTIQDKEWVQIFAAVVLPVGSPGSMRYLWERYALVRVLGPLTSCRQLSPWYWQ